MVETLPPGYERTGDGRLRPPPIFAQPGLEEQFWTDGFVYSPMLDAKEVEELTARFSRLTPHDGFDPTQIDNPLASYHCTFIDPDTAYRREADELVRSTFADRLRTVIPGYEILTSNIYVKPPGHGRFAIHQNWPTIEDLDVPTLTVWVPIQDTTFSNGTVRVIRGSHHVFPDVSAATSDKFFQDFDAELIEAHLEPMDVRAGEALIFDDSLLHWSGNNLSDQPRVTFQIEMVPRGVRTVLWVRNADDESQFDLWEVDKEYWIEYPFSSALGTPEGLPLAGHRPNPNHRITYAEFADALRRRAEIHRSKYDFSWA